jgi:hypothetical protein
MIAYRSDSEPMEPRAAWRALASRAEALTPSASRDDLTALLIDLGEVESAIADRLNPERDSLHPLADEVAEASLAVARLFVLSWHSADPQTWRAPWKTHAARLEALTLPLCRRQPGAACRKATPITRSTRRRMRSRRNALRHTHLRRRLS